MSLGLGLSLALSTLADRGESRPWEYQRFTQVQQDYLSDTSRRKAFVGANQVGKTYVGATDALGRMRGQHPALGRWRPVPVHGWCVNDSWRQSLVIQRKVRELVADDEIASACKYTHKNGFSGGYLELTNGSSLSFVTVNQETGALASATLDFIWVDEPPPAEVWGELVSRLRKRRGTLFLTLTPINRPVEWLREKCEAGEISTHWAELTVANCTPQGLPPFITRQEIEEYEADLLPVERDQRMGRSWEGRAVGAVLDHWGPHCITTEPPPAFDSRGRAVVARVGLGTDHGAGAGRQCSHLVYVCMLDGTPHVWIWDEAWDEDRTADWEDARAILDMLERNGVLLPEVDEVIGDRPHGGDRYGNAKSNLQLQAEVARLLGVRVDQLPRAFRDWRTAEKWEGSSLHGFRLLNKLARRGHLHVHPRCERFIQGAKYWSGKPKDPLKDALDSARYPVEVMVDGAVLFDSYARQAR